MADCEYIAGCPFFHGKMAAGLPAIVESMKQKFCKGSSDGCARHMVFKAMGKGSVPADLVPNQASRAQTIIAQAGQATA